MSATRKLLLGLALVATVVASVLDFPVQETVEPPIRTPDVRLSGAAREPAKPAVEPGMPPVRFGPAVADLFVVRTWQAPAAPMAGAAPPAAVVAPPLPFRYLGKLVQEGAVTAFLSQGSLTHLARKGDVLAGYRVDEVTASDVTFTYLRLNERQRLTFGSTP